MMRINIYKNSVCNNYYSTHLTQSYQHNTVHVEFSLLIMEGKNTASKPNASKYYMHSPS